MSDDKILGADAAAVGNDTAVASSAASHAAPDYVNEYFTAKPMGIVEGLNQQKYRQHVRPRITCADGFAFSVQASEHHYCTPREDDQPIYSAVEVGYPTERVESLMPYVDGDGSTHETVYGYVPVEIVNAIIKAHGGVK